jgi:hypothetical protein
MRKAQLTLNHLLLVLTAVCLWSAQFSLKASPTGTSIATKVLAGVNFVIVVAVFALYPRYKSRALWVAAFTAIFATGIAVLLST